MFKTFSTTIVLGLLTLSMAHAQSSELRARIPFSFQVAHKTLEAGTYQLTHTAGSPLFNLRRVDQTPEGASVMTSPIGLSNHPGQEAKLVFDCYGGSCYLAQVWQSGSRGGAGLRIVRSKPERGIALSTRAALITISAK